MKDQNTVTRKSRQSATIARQLSGNQERRPRRHCEDRWQSDAKPATTAGVVERDLPARWTSARLAITILDESPRLRWPWL